MLSGQLQGHPGSRKRIPSPRFESSCENKARSFARGKNDYAPGGPPRLAFLVWGHNEIFAHPADYTVSWRQKWKFNFEESIKVSKLEKLLWLDILRMFIEALKHCHNVGVLHNGLKSNNVVLERRNQQWNPVIIDFGKAQFVSLPKPLMSLSEALQ